MPISFPPDSESDRTTRARIRDAAILQFADRGFNGATIRGIAQQAGVSAGLVQHHFGTKDGLRKACDSYILAKMREILDEGYVGGAINDPSYIDQISQTLTPFVNYIATAMNAGSETATRWFEMLIEFNRQSLQRGDLGKPLCDADDVDAIAAVFTGYQLGFLTMYQHVTKAVGGESSETSTTARIARARFAIFSGELFSEDMRDRLRAGIERYEAAHASDSPEAGE